LNILLLMYYRYHGLAEKEEGARLYSLFVKTLQERLLSAVSQQQQQQEGGEDNS
jgi:hypothetical protein